MQGAIIEILDAGQLIGAQMEGFFALIAFAVGVRNAVVDI
jgi:hypothetical protein